VGCLEEKVLKETVACLDHLVKMEDLGHLDYLDKRATLDLTVSLAQRETGASVFYGFE
jgi:hypothetical protein